MAQNRGRILSLRVGRGIDACDSPEAAAEAALDELGGTVRYRRAAVMGWGSDESKPTLLAVRPRADDWGTGEHRSGSLVSIPLQANGRPIGLLSLSPMEHDGLDPADHRTARRIAGRLAARLDVLTRAAQGSEPSQAEIERRVRERTASLHARVAMLEQANRRLRETNTALESFVHAVSHDLASPVRTIRSHTKALVDALDTPGAPDPQTLQHARCADEDTARLGTLIEDLAAYNRLGHLQERFIALDLQEAVDQALTQLASAIEQAGARIHVDAPLPEAMGHHATIVQAVMNLVANAIKFVAPGVTPEVRIHGDVVRGNARLSVTDNGIGIRGDQTDQVFHAFERLHGADAYPGSGLGLAIVHRGITQLGGRVGVDSTPALGSTFWLELPRPTASVAQPG
jgi:signal transduction histidine kinase